MNETLKAYCDAANIVFTRCRPYRKNDQAFVEQKNGAVVRRMVGYRRLEGLEAAKLLAELYRSARLFVNFFQPSFKLMAKQRDGARVRKTYSAPATPHQRLAADARTPDAIRHHLQEIYAALDPVALLRDIRGAQERLAALADTQPIAHPAAASQPIDLFLASLRTAWKDGAMRPTDRPIVKAKRGRRRPDPLIRATLDLRKWFEAEPWRTGSELLSGCRRNILEPIRTSFFERFSVGLNPGAASKRTRCCSFLRRKRCWGMRSQQPNDVADASGGGRALRNPGHLRTRPPPQPKPGAK